MKKKLIIFDLDGVLVDACDWHRIAFNESLREICNLEIPLEEHYSDFNGLPTRVKLEKLFNKNLIKKEEFEKIERLKQIKTIDTINKNANIREEKIQLMRFLKNNHFKIACYTNSIRMTCELMLKKTGIFEYFDLILTNQDVKNAKPSPEGYIKVLKVLNIDAKEALIIEDSPKGLIAAKESGCDFIAVKNPEDVNIELLKGIL